METAGMEPGRGRRRLARVGVGAAALALLPASPVGAHEGELDDGAGTGPSDADGARRQQDERRTWVYRVRDDGVIEYGDGRVTHDPASGETTFARPAARQGAAVEEIEVAGRRGPEGCETKPFELTLQPGGPVSVAMHEVSRNDQTCRSTYVIEHGPAAAPAAPAEHVHADEDTLTPSNHIWRSYARMRIWFEDVAQLAVSEVHAHMRADRDGLFVSNADGWGTQDMAETGWSVVSFGHSWGYENVNTQARTTVVAEHHNHTFCWPKNVHTHYPNVFAWVRRDGVIGGGNQNEAFVSHHDVTWLPCPPLSRHGDLHYESNEAISHK